MAPDERNKITSKQRYERLKAAGLCVVCGKDKAAGGTVRCETCRSKMKVYQKINTDTFIKAHICVSCHKEDALNGLQICEKCRKKRTEYQSHYLKSMPEEKKQERLAINREQRKKRYALRKELGLCVFCGKPAVPGQVLCTECRQYNNESRFDYLEREARHEKRKHK